MNCGHWNVLNYRQIRTPFKLWSETIRSPIEATAFRTLILIMWSEHEDCAAWRLWQSWETSWYFLIITAIKENCMVSIYIKQYSSIFISMKKSKVSVLVCVCTFVANLAFPVTPGFRAFEQTFLSLGFESSAWALWYHPSKSWWSANR